MSSPGNNITNTLNTALDEKRLYEKTKTTRNTEIREIGKETFWKWQSKKEDYKEENHFRDSKLEVKTPRLSDGIKFYRSEYFLSEAKIKANLKLLILMQNNRLQ